MIVLAYKIYLLTDAQPGTGLGGVTTDSYIPRDHFGRPTIPSSHIKGLMREELLNIEKKLSLKNFSCDSVLGKGGESLHCQGRIRVTGTVLQDESETDTFVVTRTAIDDKTGTALDNTLRSTESLAAGTVLENGSVTIDALDNSAEDLAVRLALRSISAIGGNRNRGSGRCRVEIKGETRSPGELLKAFLKALSDTGVSAGTSTPSQCVQLSGRTCWVDIVFRADQPVCCPENPTRANAIQSGFSIPASAVMGTFLHRVNRENSDLATACFKSNAFRAWPLLPCADDNPGDPLPFPVQVSLTHRIAKQAGAENFQPEYARDNAVEPRDTRAVTADNPFKAFDGVLLRGGQQTVFWKSSEMPKVVLAHGALNSSTDSFDGKVKAEGRGLYQMTSMAPMIWRGIASIPEEMTKYICGQWPAAFGKHRGTMGGGMLTVKKTGFRKIVDIISDRVPVFIAQSPILLPKHISDDIIDTFTAMIREWCKTHGLPPVKSSDKRSFVWGTAGIRFGWNRHHNGYAGAEKVIMPGAVFRLERFPDIMNLETAVKVGMGGGRNKGFGALAMHPGKAASLFEHKKTVLRKKSSGASLTRAIRAVVAVRDKNLPSASQLYALKSRLETGGVESAIRYLGMQENRDAHIAAAWRDVKGPIGNILASTGEDTTAAGAAIKMLADFAGQCEGEN